MIKIYHPDPASIIARPRNRTNNVDSGAPISKEKQDVSVSTQFVERRKSKSDRREKRVARGPFDMRNGRDRRRNSDPNPSVDIEV